MFTAKYLLFIIPNFQNLAQESTSKYSAFIFWNEPQNIKNFRGGNSPHKAQFGSPILLSQRKPRLVLLELMIPNLKRKCNYIWFDVHRLHADVNKTKIQCNKSYKHITNKKVMNAVISSKQTHILWSH